MFNLAIGWPYKMLRFPLCAKRGLKNVHKDSLYFQKISCLAFPWLLLRCNGQKLNYLLDMKIYHHPINFRAKFMNWKWLVYTSFPNVSEHFKRKIDKQMAEKSFYIISQFEYFCISRKYSQMFVSPPICSHRKVECIQIYFHIFS